jgi:DNA-binding Xre family transcriptional regulator
MERIQEEPSGAGDWLGCMQATGKIVGDILAPAEAPEVWEMLADIRAYDEGIAAIRAGEEMIPSRVVYALLDGENPVRVWREFRDIALTDLAEQAKISLRDLSLIEVGKLQPAPDILARLAEILRMDMNDLIEVNTTE